MLEFGHPLPGPTVTDEGGAGCPAPFIRGGKETVHTAIPYGGLRAYGEGYGGLRGAGVSGTLAKAAVGWEVGWGEDLSRAPGPNQRAGLIILYKEII